MVKIPKIELRRFQNTGEQTWDSNYTTHFISSMDVAFGLETNRDMFRLSVNNNNSQFTKVFKVNDRVEIYIYTGATPTSDDLIMDALIAEIEHDISSNGKVLTVRGINRTQELLSSLVLITFTSNTKTVDEVIQEIIDQVNNNNTARPGDERYISTNIASTKSDGSSFTQKNFVINYKTAYDAIAQFSDDEFTEDGQYIFYIDKDNVLQWQPKSTTVPAGNNITEGVNVESLKIQRGTWDVYNSVIADVGKDIYNHGNHILQINTISILDAGAKWKFLDYSTLSTNLMNQQEATTPTNFPRETGGDGTVRITSRVPDTFPFNATFNELNSSNQDLGTTWVINSAREYNDGIRSWSKKIGKEKALTFLGETGDLRYKAEALIQGSNSFVQGQLVNLNSNTADLEEYQLRITNISHSFTNQGWRTSLELEEDTE